MRRSRPRDYNVVRLCGPCLGPRYAYVQACQGRWDLRLPTPVRVFPFHLLTPFEVGFLTPLFQPHPDRSHSPRIPLQREWFRNPERRYPSRSSHTRRDAVLPHSRMHDLLKAILTSLPLVLRLEQCRCRGARTLRYRIDISELQARSIRRHEQHEWECT